MDRFWWQAQPSALEATTASTATTTTTVAAAAPATALGENTILSSSTAALPNGLDWTEDVDEGDDIL